MHTVWLVVITFFGYLIAYHTYGRWLARKIFKLDRDVRVPSLKYEDGVDFVPTQREIVFGHHFVSIAGTGPIVGPAIAIFWGWLPALLWILIGSVFIGAVHDFGSLVISLRSKGQTIGNISRWMLNKRVRILFLFILFFALMIVIAIFGLVIAVIFTFYPQSVLPVWITLPIAVFIGLLVYKSGRGLLFPTLVSLILIYLSVYVGAYFLPVDLSKMFKLELFSKGYNNVVIIWTVILLIYCFFASVLPVWILLQPRDCINSYELILTMLLLISGIMIANPEIVAPAINHHIPGDAPPIFPFLFITIACGAVSGFHSLVSSGTTSKQLKCETDALMVGYGSMLLEGGLAVIVIIACAAGLGLGKYDIIGNTAIARMNITGEPLIGYDAWQSFYGGSWMKMTLVKQIGAFIEGGANLLHVIKIPIIMGIGITSVFIASFAATTLDTATRLQRYIVQEIGHTINARFLTNKYVATLVAVITGGVLAFSGGPSGPGSGGLILWPLFGATNQVLAGLSFIIIVFYLLRTNKPIYFVFIPMLIMVILPGYALAKQAIDWYHQSQWMLFSIGVVIEGLLIWMTAEAMLLWNSVKGIGYHVDDDSVTSKVEVKTNHL